MILIYVPIIVAALMIGSLVKERIKLPPVTEPCISTIALSNEETKDLPYCEDVKWSYGE